MTETEIQASPFLSSPSAVSFDSTFRMNPDAIGLSMQRARAPKQHSEDQTPKSNTIQRRRSMFIQRDFALKNFTNRSPPLYQKDLPQAQTPEKPQSLSSTSSNLKTQQTDPQQKKLGRRLSNL